MVIENEAEYEVMVAVLDDLKTRTPDSIAIRVVAKVIEAYELAHRLPILDPTPMERQECAKYGHVPEDKLTAIICGRCRAVLVTR